MKRKHFILILSSFFLILGLLTLYFKSETVFSDKHQSILNIMQEGKDRETAIVRDVLRANALLLPNYDALVENQLRLRVTCENLKEGELHIYHVYSHDLDVAIDSYCQALADKLELMESFKMKQAVVRNSMQYIFREEARLFSTTGRKYFSPENTAVMQELVQATYSLYFVPSTSSSDRLRAIHLRAEENNELAGGKSRNQAVGFLLAHSQAVLLNAADLRNLVQSLVQKRATTVNDLQAIYMREYDKSLSISHLYKILLLLACFALLGCMVFFLSRLWKTAEALERSNADLESKVSVRTHALEVSLQTVKEQQEALISTSKMSALGEMAGGVAHEINTPLAIIGLNAEIIGELLGEENLDKKMIQENVAVISQTVQRAAKIINGLRRFSRDGKQDPAVLVPVETLFQDVLSLCCEKFKTHGVSLAVTERSEAPGVQCRPTEICQVILNLLNNSFDAIQNLPEKWIRLESYREDGHIVIAVTDSGPGLSPETREKLFQPFFTTKEIGRGTGLGLSISMGIVKAHGGSLLYEDKNPNTCFLLKLTA